MIFVIILIALASCGIGYLIGEQRAYNHYVSIPKPIKIIQSVPNMGENDVPFPNMSKSISEYPTEIHDFTCKAVDAIRAKHIQNSIERIQPKFTAPIDKQQSES